jgi:hypothetical protein
MCRTSGEQPVHISKLKGLTVVALESDPVSEVEKFESTRWVVPNQAAKLRDTQNYLNILRNCAGETRCSRKQAVHLIRGDS